MINLVNHKYSRYAPIIVSITIAINGFITLLVTAIPLINRIFSTHIDDHLSSDLYDIGIKWFIMRIRRSTCTQGLLMGC